MAAHRQRHALHRPTEVRRAVPPPLGGHRQQKAREAENRRLVDVQVVEDAEDITTLLPEKLTRTMIRNIITVLTLGMTATKASSMMIICVRPVIRTKVSDMNLTVISR